MDAVDEDGGLGGEFPRCAGCMLVFVEVGTQKDVCAERDVHALGQIMYPKDSVGPVLRTVYGSKRFSYIGALCDINSIKQGELRG